MGAKSLVGNHFLKLTNVVATQQGTNEPIIKIAENFNARATLNMAKDGRPWEGVGAGWALVLWSKVWLIFGAHPVPTIPPLASHLMRCRPLSELLALRPR